MPRLEKNLRERSLLIRHITLMNVHLLSQSLHGFDELYQSMLGSETNSALKR